MALIIKADMPTCCSACKSVQRYRYSDECEYLRKPIARNGRLKDCPIIGEIPDKHGRLVSDTDVKALVFSGLSFDKNPRSILEDYIDKLPTILEASR